jgi:hypothetical protein
VHRFNAIWLVGLIVLALSSATHAVDNDAALSGVKSRGVGESGGPNPEDTFTRMFPDLPPFAPQTNAVRSAVQQLGQKGGVLDALDNLTDPIRSITEPAVFSPNNADNPVLAAGGNMTAGMTFLGQFLDHDVTLDLRSALQRNADPLRTNNFRTAAFDLDSLYGAGPTAAPELYASDGMKFRVDEIPGAAAVSRLGAVRYDLPRDSNNVAIIGDGRNDENIIIAQLHTAMLRFHNAVVDRVKAEAANANRSPAEVFALAQRLVRWHYQWIIVNEFLPATIGSERVAELLRGGPRYYNVEAARPRQSLRNGRRDPKIPVEFSVAAYRFGHSQIRPSYRLNFGAAASAGGAPFFAFVFDPAADPNQPDPLDLRGGKRAPRRFVDWQTFFNFGDGNVRPNKLIDTKLSTPLMLLPGVSGAIPGLPSDGVQSLPARNLTRHVNFGLPSGQAIARRIGATALTPTQLAELRPYRMEASTPLWFYVLKEAEVMEQGKRLGPVGSRIVGEVFIGLLRADSGSYLASRPSWRPTLPSATAGDFRMTDLLKLAGVVPPLQ